MNWVEAYGPTVEEATNNALKQLGTVEQDAEIEILESGTKGFLGILGNKQAHVRARMKKTTEQIITDLIDQIVESLGLDIQYKLIQEEDAWRVNFEGQDVRLLIGRRGETLNAMQLVTGLIINRKIEEKVRIIIDAEGYRERREETLRRLAKRISDKVHKTSHEMTLEPMTPNERRVIHLALQDDPWVETCSTGEEPYRKVVISPKKR
jgi:spoIIIJ-associated protein